MPVISSDPGVRELISEVSKYEIIGQQAETACFKIYHTTDNTGVKEAAKMKIIKSNLRFVLKFAMDYHNSTGLPIVDFYTEGKLGLMESFYKYDYTAGVKFASFAVWEVRRHMAMLVHSRDLIKVPVRQRKRVLEALRKGKPLNMNYGEEAANAIMGPQSLDLPVGESNDGTSILLHEVIPESDPEANLEREPVMESIRNHLEDEMKRVLNPIENNLLHSLYGIDCDETSFEQEAEYVGSSKECIRRLKNRAIEKLRDSSNLAILRDSFAGL